MNHLLIEDMSTRLTWQTAYFFDMMMVTIKPATKATKATAVTIIPMM